MDLGLIFLTGVVAYVIIFFMRKKMVGIPDSDDVSVSIETDEFAERVEYSSSKVEWLKSAWPDSDMYSFRIERVKEAGRNYDIYVRGDITYRGGRGDCRQYNRAILRGSEKLHFKLSGREYFKRDGNSWCCESFTLWPTEQQLRDYVEDGKLKIQVRGKYGDTFMLEIPLSHIDAIRTASEQ